MPFFLRKALKFGPLRLNLSKSGVGASVGVTGARVGIRSSDGQPYAYGGRYGIYYRQNLGSVDDIHVSGVEDHHVATAAKLIGEPLDQTRKDWVPALRTAASGANEDAERSAAVHTLQLCSETIAQHLRGRGFPIDTDRELADALCEIQSELMLKAAFPEAYQKWDDACGDLLSRAATRARQIVKSHHGEILAKLAERHPLDNNRLAEVLGELVHKVVMPQLRNEGLVLEGNPVYEGRLGLAVSNLFFDDLSGGRSRADNIVCDHVGESGNYCSRCGARLTENVNPSAPPRVPPAPTATSTAAPTPLAAGASVGTGNLTLRNQAQHTATGSTAALYAGRKPCPKCTLFNLNRASVCEWCGASFVGE